MINEFIDYIHTLPKVLEKTEQEDLLFNYYNTRNEQTRQKILEHNLRLCAHIAQKYATKNRIEYLVFDLYSECVIALSKALDLYNPFNIQNASFSTFAANGMNYALLNFYTKENKNISKLEDIYIFNDEEDFEIDPLDSFVDPSEESLCDIIAGEELIKDVLNSIKDENRIIVQMYLGIDQKAETQYTIAEKTGHSQSYISRILKKEFKQMQNYIAKNYPLTYPKISNTDSIYDKNKNLILKAKDRHESTNNNFSIPNENLFNQFYGINSIYPCSLTDLSIQYNLSKHRITNMLHEIINQYILLGKYSEQDIEFLNEQRKIKIKELKQNRKQEKLKQSAYLYFSYYGIYGFEKKSQITLAKELNVTRQQISSCIKNFKNHINEYSTEDKTSILENYEKELINNHD